MKRLIFSVLVLSAVTANAQVKDGMVGINTDEPRATMHIEPGVSESKGLIIPRITAAQMKTMTNLTHFGADHHAIITYLKEQLPAADRTGKLVDVADPGYYYYDNTTGVQKWKTFGGGEQDLRMVGSYNHLTQDAGVGENGTSAGTGYRNIGIGAGIYGLDNSSNMTGSYNIGMGSILYGFSNNGTMSSGNNIGIGTSLFTASYGTMTMAGGNNIGIGSQMFRFSQTGNISFFGKYNISMGMGSFDMGGNLMGDNNIGLGISHYNLSGNLAGSDNIGIGRDSYYVRNGDITSNANNNIALGRNIYSLTNSIGSTFSGRDNIGIGNALYNLISGNLAGLRNIGMGNNVFRLNPGNFSGNDNIGIGSSAMQVSGDIAGNNNIALGTQNMYTSGKIAGTDNIAIGFRVLQPNDNTDIGSYNIGIGNWALWADMAKGNANIQLGNWYVGTPVAGQLNNVVAIGNQMNGLAVSNTDSDTILLGQTGSGAPKVGMGTYQPQSKLDVNGEVRVGTENGNCTSNNAGAIRFDGSNFYGCNGSTWKQLDN